MPDNSKHPEAAERAAGPGTRWKEFVGVGAVMTACGVAAILAPAVSTVAASTVLGLLLAIGGVSCVYQAMRNKDWSGVNWQLLLGAAELVGGIFIMVNPLKGAAAVTMVVAIVVFALGVTQAGLALKIRPQAGWEWLIIAGLVSVLVAIGLVLRFPFGLTESPGVMAGISLVCGGIAHAMIGVGQRAIMRRS